MAKIAFLFPGQGAQSVGMCRELDQELPAVRALFDRAGEVLGIDLRRLCIEGPAEALEATDVSQPAIYVASLAALESLKASQPDLVASCEGAAGLSLGEYTALTFAGSLEFESGLRLVRHRGQAMQAAAVATPSGMTSVLGLDEAAVDELCRRVAPAGRLWKANLLGPGNIVVSGRQGRAGAGRRRRDRAGCDEGGAARGRRRLPLGPDEAGRRSSSPRCWRDEPVVTPYPRLFECGRRPSSRPG